MEQQLPEIQVRYSGIQPPEVTLPQELQNRVRITIIGPKEGSAGSSTWEDSTLVLEYKRIRVYRTLRDSTSYSAYWFATKPSVSFESVLAFDSRRIAKVSVEEQAHYEKLFPGNAPKQRLAYAIDRGWLSEHGYMER